jgi:hypothetical protein
VIAEPLAGREAPVDFAAFQQAMQEAQLKGDREAMRRLAGQLETDELPTQHPGELKRIRFRGAPEEQYMILFAPAEQPPPTYPADLPWVPGAKTSLVVFGPGQPVTVYWTEIDARAAADLILSASVAAGWAEAPGLRLPTASGVRVVFLERLDSVRHLMVATRPEGGMIQLTQGVNRRQASNPDAAPPAG